MSIGGFLPAYVCIYTISTYIYIYTHVEFVCLTQPDKYVYVYVCVDLVDIRIFK